MLHGLLFVLLFFLLLLVIVAVVVARFLFRGMRMFRDAVHSAGGGKAGAGSGGSRRAGTGRRGSRSSGGADGETVIDTRPAEVGRRKIFSADEGEYVDYEESK